MHFCPRVNSHRWVEEKFPTHPMLQPRSNVPFILVLSLTAAQEIKAETEKNEWHLNWQAQHLSLIAGGPLGPLCLHMGYKWNPFRFCVCGKADSLPHILIRSICTALSEYACHMSFQDVDFTVGAVRTSGVAAHCNCDSWTSLAEVPDLEVIAGPHWCHHNSGVATVGVVVHCSE